MQRDQRRPQAHEPRYPAGQGRPEEGADAPGADHQAEGAGAQVQCLQRVDRVQGGEEAVPDRRVRLDQELRPDQGVEDAGAEADAEVVEQGRPVALVGGRLGVLDPGEEEGRGQERQRVEDDRRGGRDRLHEQPAQAGPDDLGDGLGRLELRVPLDESVLADQGGQIRPVGDLEERRGRPRQRRHDIELAHAQAAQPGRKRDGEK